MEEAATEMRRAPRVRRRVERDAVGVEHALAQLRADVVRDRPVEAVDVHADLRLGVEAILAKEAVLAANCRTGLQ